MLAEALRQIGGPLLTMSVSRAIRSPHEHAVGGLMRESPLTLAA